MHDETMDESGAITIMFAMTMLVISVLLVGVIDLGGAYVQRAAMENDVVATVDELKTSSFGLIVKNASSPGKTITEEVVGDLRRNGQTGKVLVYVAGAAEDEVPEDKRVTGVWVVLEDKYHAMTAGKLLDDIDLYAEEGCYLVPYSSGKAWRPSGSTAGASVLGVYTVEAGKTTSTYKRLTKSQMPAQAMEQLQKGMEKANEGN